MEEGHLYGDGKVTTGKPLLVITHNNTFHADDVLSTALLAKLYGQVRVIRTRDKDIIKEGDIVYDVGFVCDKVTRRFDHHMAWFKETFNSESKVKLSSSGLIYKYYTKDIFRAFGYKGQFDETYEFFVQKVYDGYFKGFDGIDNGESWVINKKGIVRNPSQQVSCFNSVETDFSSYEEYAEKQYEQFFKAVDFLKQDIENYLWKVIHYDMVCYAEFLNPVKDCKGPVLVLKGNPIIRPVIIDLVETYNPEILFTINKDLGGIFRVYTVPKSSTEHFSMKCPLYKGWRGLEGELLKDAEVKGILFVHSTGFTGSAQTLDAAIEMCHYSIEHKCDE